MMKAWNCYNLTIPARGNTVLVELIFHDMDRNSVSHGIVF